MRWLALVAMSGSVWSVAQQPVPAQQLSPQAAYDEAARPLEIVRSSVKNWSDIELAGLAVSATKAGAACDTRTATNYSGDDLVALARLCSFGQRWELTHAAAARYIHAPDVVKPQLSLAYAIQLSSTLQVPMQLQSERISIAMAEARAMLANVPYDANVDAGCATAVSYMQLLNTKEALEIESLRQPLLLAALSADKPPLPRHSLYASGLTQGELLQYVDRIADAAASRRLLDQALGDEAKLVPDDALLIADARRQYDLLGKPLPELGLMMSLADPAAKPAIDFTHSAATALLLFPDWCAQCVKLGPHMWKLQQLPQGRVRLYGLLAAAMPEQAKINAAYAALQSSLPHGMAARPVAPKSPEPEPPKSAAIALLMTQTFVVPPETVQLLAADEFPFLIVVDARGVVRFAASASEASLDPGGYVDQVVDHVAETWAPKGKL